MDAFINLTSNCRFVAELIAHVRYLLLFFSRDSPVSRVECQSDVQ